MAGSVFGLLSSSLLLLLLAQQSSSQNTTSVQPAIPTDSPQATADPPGTGGRQNWTTAEDGVMEIDDFTGPDIPVPDLQEGRYLRIANSIIQAIPEGTFRVHSNITNATLEIINSTIHQWGANNMDSFASVTVTNSIIRRLNSSGIRFRPGSTRQEDQEYDIVVTFNGTTIDEVDLGGLDLGRALLQIAESTIVALNGGALRLGVRSQLRVTDTRIGALGADSLCQVCSHEIHFERNQLLHVPAHALHFGSSACNEGRIVVAADNRLPCDSLGWLRDALRSCGSLTKRASEDYVKFRDTSDCSDWAESVKSFLSRKPEPEPQPTPEPAFDWCHSVGTAAGIAVALAVGFLVVGVLGGWNYRGTRAAAGLHAIPGASSRSIPDGDAGITLPLERLGGDQRSNGGTDSDAHRRESAERYVPAPACPTSSGRPRASTPPMPQQTRQRSPRPSPADAPRQNRGRRQRAADPPAAHRPRRRQQQPALADDEQLLYVNLQPQQAGTNPDSSDYVNLQPQPAGDQEPLYENQPPKRHPEERRRPETPDRPIIYGNLHFG